MSYVEKHIKGNTRKITWINSIRVKMVLIILIASSSVLAVSGFLVYRYFEDVKSSELSTLADVTASRLSQHLVTPMWDVNRERVGKLLEAEMAESKIVKIVVLDEDGESIFSAKERLSSGIANTADKGHVSNALNSSSPITNGENQLGLINVYLGKRALAEELTTLAGIIAIVTMALGLALTVVTALALGIIVVRPLRNLTENAENISRGDFRQKIDVSRKDEIGYLGSTIDRMQYGLRVAAMRLRKNVAKPV